MRVCVDCGSSPVVERRRCKECAKSFNRKRAKERHEKYGRYNYGQATCPICGKAMTLWDKDQGSHTTCRYKTTENYNDVPRDKKGNTFVRGILIKFGIEIPKTHVVHHVDENPWNNTPENLWLIKRNDHNALHRKLQHGRSLWLKGHSSNGENCWDTVRDQITTAWLETAGANVIKISDIWQSASESLRLKEYLINYEKGSETVYTIPKF